MSNKEEAELLLKLVGGKKNIISIQHCMTRCRLELVDKEKADIATLKTTPGVMGVVDGQEQLQVIYGPGKVGKVTEELKKLVETKGVKIGEEGVKEQKSKLKEKNNTPFKHLLKNIGNIFIPLIPLFVGCGLVLAVNNIASVYMGDPYKTTVLAQILSLVGNGVFSILPILVGVNAAKEFGSQMPMIGGVLGGILSSSALSNIELFGQKLTSGRGGIISVILVVILACFIEKQLKRVVPDILDLFLVPFLTLLFSVVAALLIIQPIGGFISDGIGLIVAQTIASTNTLVSVVSGGVMGALFLPLVMTGLHQALTPIHTDLISTVGYTVLLPVLATAGMAQVGAAFAIFTRTKNKRLKSTAANGLIPGVLGVGEPLIYGLTLPLGKPFLGACLGAGIGGALMAFFNVGSIAIGVSGLPLALLIADGKMLLFLGGVAISYFAGYFFTLLLGFDDPVD